MEMVEKDFVIIGAGIAGLATAVALKRLGINAYVLEKSDSLRATGAALTLFPNAWLALDALGVSHKLTSIYAPTTREFVTNLGTGATKEISFAGTSGHGSGPRSVHRKNLLEALAGELPVDTIRFSSKITLIETQTHDGSSIAILRLGDGTIIKAKVLIGCDGIHSTVSRWLGLSEPVNSGRSSVRGMAVFPQGHELNQEVRQFVDVGIRAGFIPLNDKDVYWFFNCKSPPKGWTHFRCAGHQFDPKSPTFAPTLSSIIVNGLEAFVESEEPVTGAERVVWKRQDQLLKSWLLS